MTGPAVIALDLGGTKLAGAVFTPRGRMLCRSIVPLDGRQGRAVGALICSELAKLLAAARSKRIPVSAIGISVPGISHSRRGKVWAPNIPGWKDYPLRRELTSAVRGTGIRVAIDSDRACYILGETWRGAARGCRNAIFLAVGTGIGAGIMADGRILRGAHDIAGAIGWLALDRPFRREYISCGCFEHHASGEGLGKVAQEFQAKASRRPRSGGQTGARQRGERWTAAEIFTAHARGDRLAREVIAQAVEFWGMAVANLVSLFNPEKIIFGGGVFGPGTKLLRDIHAEAKKWAQPISIGQVKMGASQLGGDAGLYGAACLAWQQAEPNQASGLRHPREGRRPRSE
jgi:glucokinase